MKVVLTATMQMTGYVASFTYHLFTKSFCFLVSNIGFVVIAHYSPGACIINTRALKGTCESKHSEFYTQGCPTRFGIFAVLMLGLYIISYAPGMGTALWIVNSEIYPLRYRGTGGGTAVSNWTCNLIVSQTFLTLTKVLTTAGGFTFVGMIAIYFLLPETKGLQFDEIERTMTFGAVGSQTIGS